MTDKLEEILKSGCSVIVGDLGGKKGKVKCKGNEPYAHCFHKLKEAFVAGQSTKCNCIAGDTSASRCKCFDAGHKSCEAAHMSEIAEFEAKIGAYEENLLDKNQRIAELEGACFDAGHKSCEAAHMSEIAEFEAKIGAYEENLLDKNQRIAELEGALFWVEENYRGTTAGDCARKALSEKIP